MGMKMIVRVKVRIFHSLELFGLNLLKTRTAVTQYGRYGKDKQKFQDLGGVISEEMPILSDFNAEGGTSSGHYFHQDLLVASMIFAKNPKRHVDVGSRVDGFCAHVAAFREITVIDINPTRDSNHPNLIFETRDLMSGQVEPITDSLSCLHAIEHFGLGRYGDPINPNGHLQGFENLVKMLSQDGTLYISFPISNIPRVGFNAHRIFHPREILNWPSSSALQLERFDYVDDRGNLHARINLMGLDKSLVYGCGIYTFRKSSRGE